MVIVIAVLLCDSAIMLVVCFTGAGEVAKQAQLRQQGQCHQLHFTAAQHSSSADLNLTRVAYCAGSSAL